MYDLRERVAYLQGLMAGLGNNSSTSEGKILSEMAAILGDFADDLKELRDNQAELESYVEAIDEDLLNLEDEVYYTEIDDELDEEDLIEVQCPECNDIVYFDAALLDEDDIIEVTCPNCDVVVYSNEDESDLDENDHVNYAEDI